VETLTSDGVTGADVPRLVHDPLQAQRLRYFDAREGVSHVHFVGKKEDGDFSEQNRFNKTNKNFTSLLL